MVPRRFESVGKQVEIIEVDRYQFRRVIPFDIFLHQFPLIETRIPEKLGDDPGAELHKVAGRAVIIPLFKKADNVVVDEVVDVIGPDTPIREREQVKAEIRHVVPDKDVVGHPGPAFHVVAERSVLFPFAQGLDKGTFDTAEADDHVIARAGQLRRLARELIRKCIDVDVGIDFFDLFGHPVNETDIRPHLRFFLVGDGLALGAFAVALPVVLADRDDGGFRVLCNLRQDALEHFLEQLFVGQAELRAAGMNLFRLQTLAHFFERRRTAPRPAGIPDFPHAVDFREPVGMGFKFGRGNDGIERMDEMEIGLMTAVFFGNRVAVSVAFHVYRKRVVIGSDHPLIKRFTVDQFRRVDRIEIRDRYRIEFRNERFRCGPPPAAELIFEKRIDRVKHPPLRVTRKDDTAAGLLNHNRVVAERVFIDTSGQKGAAGRRRADHKELLRRIGADF